MSGYVRLCQQCISEFWLLSKKVLELEALASWHHHLRRTGSARALRRTGSARALRRTGSARALRRPPHQIPKLKKAQHASLAVKAPLWLMPRFARLYLEHECITYWKQILYNNLY
jgi:hypothetical protein